MLKYIKVLLASLCLVICVCGLAFLGSKYGKQLKVTDLQNQCRWTDSDYLYFKNEKEIFINPKAELYSLGASHDVQICADHEGNLNVTVLKKYYLTSESVRSGYKDNFRARKLPSYSD
jgi:hypothetical protein